MFLYDIEKSLYERLRPYCSDCEDRYNCKVIRSFFQGWPHIATRVPEELVPAYATAELTG